MTASDNSVQAFTFPEVNKIIIFMKFNVLKEPLLTELLCIALHFLSEN